MKLTGIRSVFIHALTITFTDLTGREVIVSVEVSAATKEVLSIKGYDTVLTPHEKQDIVAFLKTMGIKAS